VGSLRVLSLSLVHRSPLIRANDPAFDARYLAYGCGSNSTYAICFMVESLAWSWLPSSNVDLV